MENEPEKLAAAARAGDAQAFGSLYELYFDRIYRFIYYRCLHRETAEDLCSKTFLKALGGLTGFDSEKGSFGSWLYRIALNNLTDHFRKSGRFEVVSDVWELPSEQDPLFDAHNRLYWEKLKPVFDELEPAKKEIIIMRVWDGLSFGEIAELTGRSEAACKMTFKRTIVALRKSVPLSMLMLFIVFKQSVL
ncbi:MAG: sigma-70 family RNA polymerase sigma factor [Spirochaetales bacterium]|nr:sigma-70 family RNA polymerase sigma factor [Spirochaetales bacterium]